MGKAELPQDVRIALAIAVMALYVRGLSKQRNAAKAKDNVERMIWQAEAENDKRAAERICEHFGITIHDELRVPPLAFVTDKEAADHG